MNMKKINGLMVAICQMAVVPGRPDLNAGYVIKEIKRAAEEGADIIVFPEMCIPGYVIGDKYEDEAFVRDVHRWNLLVIKATEGLDITAIFGSLTFAEMRKGEDGRLRKFNTALVAQNGALAGSSIKTLQPNYRIFDDDRYYFSVRKNYEEFVEKSRISGVVQDKKYGIGDYFPPINIKTRNGELNIGVILCEDGWPDDYALNPTRYLVDNGAEMIFDLSCSPWSWQKNRKRNSVIKNLLKECPVPFVYVNNVGTQNNGKNIIVFDGSSTVYGPDGSIIFEVPAYTKGTSMMKMSRRMPAIEQKEEDDTAELGKALLFAAKENIMTMPPSRRKVVIGLSGGIDSALSAAIYVYLLGRENVTLVNMPTAYNTAETKNIAREIADNLGVELLTIPIQPIVDAIAASTGCPTDSLAYENIQARARMEILAARAQMVGGFISANFNKVETAFGYGTLYGDIAGFVSLLGDLVKREVYQVADYMNREIYKREVIPQSCFDIAPTAELRVAQKDPFDYGNLDRRGYHDEMVRAFVEFRRNPEWFLELYLEKKLEQELRLSIGTINRLFPTPEGFIKDMERCWGLFCGAVFKRVQAPPIPIVSKRAFGYDLRESILSVYETQKYRELKKKILAK